jgi:glycosyltransferase involved in cell wall biosynthesis
MQAIPPLLSIVVPTVNPGSRVTKIIHELLSTKSQNFEVVISINASSEKLLLDADSRFDSRLKINVEAKRLNVAENWTRAVKISTGKFIWLIGDDDFIKNNQLESLLQNLEKKEVSCFSFNGSSYIFPSELSNHRALARHRHFDYENSILGEMNSSKRKKIVLNMFRFRPLIPLNMQLTIFSRQIFEDIGNTFKMPFPDHIALMEMIALKQPWEIIDRRFCIVGMASTSFGNSAYTNSDSVGESYLGMSRMEGKQIPGNVLNSVMFSWLQDLINHNHAFSKNKISNGDYILRQVGVGFRQFTSRIIDGKTFLDRIRQVTFTGWVQVFCALARPSNLKLVYRILNRKPGIDRIIGSRFELVEFQSISDFSKDPTNSGM